MSTALQLITDALLKINAIAAGDVLTAEEANDGLRALNDLLENWSLEPQSVMRRATEYFTTVPGQGTYTIGTGGNWSTTRPVRIGPQAVCRYQGVDFPVVGMGQAEYDLIPLKSQPGDIAERFLYVNDYPLGAVTLWPVPSAVVSIGLEIDRQLTAAATLYDTLVFPPGYRLGLLYHLAVMLAPDYKRPVPPEVAQGAANFKADIKRANRKSRVARFDDVPGVQGGGYGSNDWRVL